MNIKLTFLGAAQNVTGSRYLLEANGLRILVDCGLYQERGLRARNWEPFHIPPYTLKAVLLTHGHLDHCGLLPKLVREGFKGKIYGTPATSEIAHIVMMDAAHIQEEDAAFKQKRHQKERRQGPYPEIPLYTTEDAQAVLAYFSPVNYHQPINIGEGVEATFYDAGHILGSAMIKVTVSQNSEQRAIIFSGDIGRWKTPILLDPTVFNEADYILMESTYGDRLHGDRESIDELLAEIINTTHQAGGNILIPSFAVERSQEVLYYLNDLLVQDRIPHLTVFMDSPMAISVTRVFENHPELFDEDMRDRIRRHESPFDFQGLKMTGTIQQSKAINHIRGTVIIIAGSGMCTAGRIKHHLIQNISRPESTILFVGYQATGTLGRLIVDGEKKVRILGEYYPVKARIVKIDGFSAHADRDELWRWISALRQPPRHLFITHGEPVTTHHFAEFLNSKTGWQISVPSYQQEAVLD